MPSSASRRRSCHWRRADRALFAGVHPRPLAVLYGVLEPLAMARISMNRIESRPEHGHKWQYAFFIDVAGLYCDERH
ncbi:MAG: hypothetical protein U1F19_01685 [Lysobacterales bacterium]